MSTLEALSKDDPRMIAWEAWKQSDEFSNAKRWATNERHVDGSLWAAFLAGVSSPPPSTQDAEREKSDLGITEPLADHDAPKQKECHLEPDALEALRAFETSHKTETLGVTLLQRRLRWGWVRACHAVDELVNCGKVARIGTGPHVTLAFCASEADSVVLGTDSAKGPCLQSQIPIVTPAASTQNTVKGQKELAHYFLCWLEMTRNSSQQRYEEIKDDKFIGDHHKGFREGLATGFDNARIELAKRLEAERTSVGRGTENRGAALLSENASLRLRVGAAEEALRESREVIKWLPCFPASRKCEFCHDPRHVWGGYYCDYHATLAPK